MVNFAKKLLAAERPEWKGHYLEYKKLKKQLKYTLIAAKSEFRSATAEHNFEHALDAEVERVVLFFLAKQGDFARTLSELRQQQERLAPNDLVAVHDLSDRFRHVGDDLVQLLVYVELNATGIRKILKKHDKSVKERKIMGSYLSSRMESQASHLQQLYHDEGISAIIATIRSALIELRSLENKFSSAEASSSSSSLVVTRSYRSISETEPIFNKIELARRRLHQSTTYVKTVAAQALIFDGESSEDEEDEATYESFKRIRTSKASRFLNMMCTFLYMANYYIVAPTSGQYAAKLGAAASLSGIIVGMTPIAALVSSVLYSWWANRSYKSPLVFATMCLIVGNLLYGLALSFGSIEMVILGRLLNGFGGARAINRRYIADNYTREERTEASAMFVTASALGMSLGPALAAAFDFLPNIQVLGVIVNNETAPGWIMLLFWGAYLAAIIFLFEEPDRAQIETLIMRRRSTMTSIEAGMAGVPVNESTKLLGGPSAPAPAKAPSLCSLWTNVPVVATLVIYIVLKLVLESLLTSSSILAKFYFHWDSTETGTYLAVLGLLMFPSNIVVGWLCRQYEDRELVVASELFMVLGVCVIVKFGESYSMTQFIAGGVIIFISTNVLEGVNMSILSKTIPRAFAKGTFNSGLLATEAGTFGRALGDVAITVVGLPGIEYVLNYTFIPLIGLSVLVTVYTLFVYRHLAVEH